MSSLVKVVRSQEQNAKVVSAIEHLNSAHAMMKETNREAILAHLAVSWRSLIEARELSDEESDRLLLDDYVFSTRRMLDDINSPTSPFPPSQKILAGRHLQISKTINDLGVMSARLRARLTGIGANQ